MPTRVVNITGRRAPGGAPPPGVTYISHAMYRSGWRLPESKWATPYRPDTSRRRRDGTPAEVVAKYRTYLLRRLDLLEALPELRDKTLGCWCAPPGGLTAADTPYVCHGQVLAELADAGEAD